MKKRILALILAVILPIIFCSCSNNAKVKVNSTKIGKGIYAYFEDAAKIDGEKTEDTDVDALAESMLIRYVAINSEFENRGLELSLEEKSDLSNTVNSYWHLFSTYYNDIGVSKQDLFKIEESKSYEKRLMQEYYSEDGDSPVSDETLKEYFANNFIAFRAATGFLTTVDSENNTVSLSDAEKQTMAEKFNRMANEMSEGISSIDNASSYAENVAVTENTVVIGRGNTQYPDGFFDSVLSIEVGKTGSFIIGDYIFAVTRMDVNTDELYQEYKADCLEELKGEEFESVVDGWMQAYSVN